MTALGALTLAGTASPEPFEGRILAERDCPATVSTKRPDNPGRVHLRPGETYVVIARNKADASHWQLRIEGVHPKDRWVAVDCGRLLAEGESAPARARAQASGEGAVSSPKPRPAARSMAGQMVLAASWQPAFCERRPHKPECRTQTPSRADARQFSLHGLWPQPIGNSYCGVDAEAREDSSSGDWDDLAEPALDAQTRGDLALSMPGMLSHLHRHEWTKHGTCYGTDADTYFDHSMALLGQLNDSPVQALFAANIGKRLRVTQVRAAFDEAFGPGAGDRVRMECDRDGLIEELRIGLKGPIGDGSRLADLIHAAPRRSAGCRGGWVDRAGRGR